MWHRAAENEAARLDAGDLVDLRTGPGVHQLVDLAAEGEGIGQERGDIAKQDPRLGVIRDGANGLFQIKVKGHAGLFLTRRHSGARASANYGAQLRT